MREDQLVRWLESCDIPGRGTLFCDRHYQMLDGCAHEVAPHPLISEANDWRKELARQRALYPAAKSWRSHSLFFSQTICVELHRLGYKVVSVVEHFGMKGVAPYKLPWGPTQMPVYYMDNSDFCNFNDMHDRSHRPFDPRIIDVAVSEPGVYVFDFHPIHLELNTPSYEFYAANRDQFRAEAKERVRPYSGYGTRSFYDDLVAAMRRRSIVSTALCDAQGDRLGAGS